MRARFGLTPEAEVTLECNPGSDERGDAAAWRAAGVNRLSIGAQSPDPGELRRLGRRHGPGDIAATVEEARAAAIGSVSLDLLYDLPGQDLARWMATLDDALTLGPDHVSLYALTLDDPDAEGLAGADGDHLPTPAGARRWRDRARTEQDEDRAAAMYHHATHRLAEAGWRGYEISNWALPGHQSRHNLAYWRRRPYEAVGPGATRFEARFGPQIRRHANYQRVTGHRTVEICLGSQRLNHFNRGGDDSSARVVACFHHDVFRPKAQEDPAAARTAPRCGMTPARSSPAPRRSPLPC